LGVGCGGPSGPLLRYRILPQAALGKSADFVGSNAIKGVAIATQPAFFVQYT
jgi:hypothetical protein